MTLPIYAEARLVAVIESGRGGPHVSYDEGWREAQDAFPISLSMPLNAPTYGGDVAVW